MWHMFDMVAQNVGVSFENTLLLVVNIGALIFYAQDFKLGVVLQMFLNGLCFMMFYALGLEFAIALILFFMLTVIMAFTLYAINKQANVGGIAP